MKQLQAYLGETEQNHRVCNYCPDRTEVEQVVNSLEWKREIDELMRGFMDYVRKQVSHGICDECKERHFPRHI